MANGRGQTDLMFAALVVLAAQSLVLFAALERLASGRKKYIILSG
jgi:putative hydroxymethylpyrimidine transport system permease protein